MSGWGCPHEDKVRCLRRGVPCDPGAEGCVLAGRPLTSAHPLPPAASGPPASPGQRAADGEDAPP